jgi:hypothetical protein
VHAEEETPTDGRTVPPPPRVAQNDAFKRVLSDRALFARYLDERDPVSRQDVVARFLPLADVPADVLNR